MKGLDAFSAKGLQLGTAAVATATGSFLRDGKISLVSVAADAFGNALGSSLAESINNSESAKTGRLLTDLNKTRQVQGLELIDSSDSEAMSIVRGIVSGQNSKLHDERFGSFNDLMVLSGQSPELADATQDRLVKAFDNSHWQAGEPTGPAPSTFGRPIDNVLQGTGRLVGGFGEFLRDNPAVTWGLKGVEFAFAPVLVAGRTAINELTPVGGWIESAQQSMIGVVADRMTASGYGGTEATDGGVGALTISSMAASGIGGTIAKLDSVAGMLSGLRSRLNGVAPQALKFWKQPAIFGNEKVGYRKVYQRDDLFDPHHQIDGVSNIDRMSKGKPPIGKDNEPINLHHAIQDEPGPLVEVGGKFHSENTAVLHGLAEPKTSFRYSADGVTTEAEKAFNRFKYSYWKQRAEGFK